MESLCNYTPVFSALSMKQSHWNRRAFNNSGRTKIIITNNSWLFEGIYSNVSKPLLFTKRDKCNYHSSKVGKDEA